jgi:hypothetical protein
MIIEDYMSKTLETIRAHQSSKLILTYTLEELERFKELFTKE